MGGLTRVLGNVVRALRHMRCGASVAAPRYGLGAPPSAADLGLQALDVTEDRGDRERASVQAEAEQAIRGVDVAVDGDIVPPLCMTYIVDWNVGVLAPEEGDGVEGSVEPEHVQRRDLSLALGDNPMLDASELARVRVRPARDVARGEDAGALVSSLASTATPRS